jgi:hypothetical protein
MIMVKAMREASSMQTWTNSQPAPWPFERALLCPLRSPVMRFADLVEATELLDVDVDELAGMLAFIAPHRLGRLEVPEAAEAGAVEDAADRGGRDPGGLGDVLAREAPAAQRDHLIDDGGARRLSQALRA